MVDQEPPLRVASCEDELPLHDLYASRAVESALLRSMPEGSLMARAGLAVARWALAVQPHARRVWVAAGPGGNGGDGLHAAAHLARAGLDVRLSWITGPSAPRPDVLQGLERARHAGVRVLEGLPDTREVDLALDALLGLGADRPPQGALAESIRALNAGPASCLSLDLPSGLNGDTGTRLGADTVRAHATLSLLTLKPGLFMGSGRDHAGEIWFDPLVSRAESFDKATGRLAGKQTWLDCLPQRQHAQHKGSFGDVVLVGGDRGMLGALRLAGEAALRAGAGRTVLSPLDPEHPLSDTRHPEWLWRARAWMCSDGTLEHGTVVCGCGAGPAVSQALPALLSRAARLVLDADALNVVATDEGLAAALRRRSARGGLTVMTPHPLEAARLLGTTTAAVQADRIAAARTLVERTGCVVVLKGSGTLTASGSGPLLVNPTGHAGLGSGGTGDVLAGWIGGLWSARASSTEDFSSQSQERLAHQVAAGAAWLHGHASEAWRGEPVVASELTQEMQNRSRRTRISDDSRAG